jgi:hypothetical protein
MSYVKNVPAWERILRFVIGLLALGYVAMSWGGSSLAAGAGLMAAMLAITGLVGFCLMCAMLGRTLDKDH